MSRAFKYFFILFFSAAAVITIYFQYVKHLPQRYTVGTIVSITSKGKGDPVVDYTYQIDGNRYENFVSRYGYERTAMVGERFLVRVPIGHDHAGILLLEKPIPDNCIVPNEGWYSVPSFKKEK